VTFLFTDIEGSTRLARELGPRWRDVVEEHNRLMRETIRGSGGIDVRTEGDAVFAVFESASAAVSAAAAAQRQIASGSWPEPIRVRMGLHTGEGILGGDDYVGLDVHRAARIAGAGHGGQVLISRATRGLVGESLPPGVSLRALGRHRLKDLPEPEDLHQLVIDGLPSDFPPPRTLEVPTNIPSPLTSFVGRDEELGRVRLLLSENRLLTLSGPGGSGKTRLAIEAATGLLPSYSDGVFFVELAAITDPVLVSSTIAVALGVPETRRPIEDSLKDAVRDREMLLVLDNFEQVLGAAPLIVDLLQVSPRLTVLVTSRAALHVSGEQELPVPPMTMPDLKNLPPAELLPEFEAVTLFAERAASVDPSFAITNENASAIAEICARLDGLPLAIELAASRIKVLSPSAVLERLDRRLALLSGGAQDLPARQRTLREAIGWSYDLLGPDEQTLFSRLAIFVGGWTIEAAERVAGQDLAMTAETLDVLSSLVDKSLVRKEASDGELRFTMLETIREFGMEILEREGEAEGARRRHAEYFLDMSEAAEPELTLRDHGWLDRIEQEHDNLRAAVRWSIDTGEVETGLRIAGAVWRFWQMRGHLAEGQRWTDELLAMPAAGRRTAARAKALSAAGSLAWWLDSGSTRALYEESLAIYRELGDERGEAEGAYNLGFARLLSEDIEEAKGLFRNAADIYRDLNDPVRLAHANTALAMAAYHEGDFAAASAPVEKARATFLAVGDLWGVALTSGTLASLALRLGDYERCLAVAIDSLEANERLGSTLGSAVSLQALAVLAVRLGRPETAVRLAGAVDRIRETAGGQAPPSIVGLEDPLERARGSLDEARTAALWEDGRHMGLEEAVALARREAQRMARPAGSARNSSQTRSDES
jgi:predicted ATPase/class 3 adenylate cyclase